VPESNSEDGTAEQARPAAFGPKMPADVTPRFIPEGASGMTVLVEWPPGDPGTPPHRHSGPCFGYVIEGAVRFELEGEPERVIKAGETRYDRAVTRSTTRTAPPCRTRRPGSS
jgi:quercetin dioxygenase-like cupin family protein